MKAFLDNNKFHYLVILVCILTSCGPDTDTETRGIARFAKVNSPKMYANPDKEIWHADIDIVFTGAPVDLEIEVEWASGGKLPDWEQDGEIVKLYFVFDKMRLDRPLSVDFPLAYIVRVTLIWKTGRKKLEVELNPSDHIATYVEPLDFDVPDRE